MSVVVSRYVASMCPCFCVCVFEFERDGESARAREREKWLCDTACMLYTFTVGVLVAKCFRRLSLTFPLCDTDHINVLPMC